MRAASEKAELLTEALPYIRRWAGQSVVIKAGGETLEDPETLDAFATDVVLMQFVGINPILVHGGGPQISELERKLGREPTFVGGLRVTDEETMSLVKMVLIGQINKRIVSSLAAQGGRAAGISGEDGMLIKAKKKQSSTGADLGYVGDVDEINPSILHQLIKGQFIPVVAPVGSGPGGSFNINADLAAGALASAMRASKLVFLTNVPGLYSDFGNEDSLVSEIGAAQLQKMVSEGMLSNGMIPKAESALAAMKEGVSQVHILDGRMPHALLVEIFTDEGIGTMVTP